ncbi:Dihydrofolate reductase [Euzebya pacifica]|uniref:Dihydrofolate reductase n=1 Tax=Euzebya pacifica TaxID=1608957 RepID=A0A346Y2Y0_9ACTN|nr:dihydrofolate reductase family protein [Euzebya pacifica]AXV08827.1 Dihydrofolate reductase [Euzebya pacifica]
MQQRVRVQNFTVSADGYATGEGQSLERPFGHADPAELMRWGLATKSWPGRTDAGGSRGLDDYFIRDFSHGIGAEIMGRNKFGPQRGPWPDHGWLGWWGDTPPFHTPVFVLTHHERPSFALADTTFHFLEASPADAVGRAAAAANGLDVRVGGGPTTIRSFVDADVVDEMHIVVAPITLGAGVRFWDDPSEFDDRFHHESVPSASGVTHHILWRRDS